MSVKWNDNLQVGIDAIDRQHKEIFKRANHFLEILNDKNSSKLEIKKETEELFFFLTDYVATHFKTEEEIHKKYNYSKRASQEEQHEEIIERINDIKYRFFSNEEGAFMLAKQLGDEVIIWLIEHVKQEIKELQEFLREE